MGRVDAISFNFADDGFVYCGYHKNGTIETYLKDGYKYNITTKQWNTISDYPGNPRTEGVYIQSGGRHFVGLGTDYSEFFNDIWEYVPSLNNWGSAAALPANGRRSSLGLSNVKNNIIVGGIDNSVGNLNAVFTLQAAPNFTTEYANAEKIIGIFNNVIFVLNNEIKINTIQVYNSLGKSVAFTYSNNEIRVDQIPGIYIVLLKTDSCIYVQKIQLY